VIERKSPNVYGTFGYPSIRAQSEVRAYRDLEEGDDCAGSSCDDAVMKIEIVGGIDQVDPDDDNVDVHLRLDDGRVFAFVVATPKNIYWCMQNEGKEYFFGVPPVFVKTLTIEAIGRALGAVVHEDGGKWLSVYGALQL
jgi:hypothetical protein